MSHDDMIQRAASRLMRQAAENVDAPGRLARLYRARRRERVFVFTGAPVAAMLLIGLPLLLFRGGDSSYIDQATTTALEQTSTTIEQTTTTVEQTSTTIEQTTTTVEQTSTTIEQTAITVGGRSISWQRVEPGPSLGAGDDANAYLLNAVVAGGPGLIAGGHVGPVDDVWDGSAAEDGTAAIWVSEDGTTWDRVPQDELSFSGSGAIIYDIMIGGPGYVAVGATFEGGTGAAVWLSEDGYSWTRVESPSFAESPMYAVAAGGPGIVAIGDSAIWFSSDGLEWQPAAQPYGSLNAVTYSNLGFVAVGHKCGRMYASEVDVGEGVLTACYPHAWISADGLNWERVDLVTNIGEWPGSRASDGWVGSFALAVIDLGDRVLIAGKSADTPPEYVDMHPTFWTSTDGTEWNARILEAKAVGGMSKPDGYISQLVETEHGLIAVGGWLQYGASPESGASPGDWFAGRLRRAAVWVSADGGVTWSEIPPGGVFPIVPVPCGGACLMEGVAVLHGKLVGVGTLGTTAGVWIGEWSG